LQRPAQEDGDGLDAAGAAALAAKLRAHRDSGDVAAYCAERDAYLAAHCRVSNVGLAAGQGPTTTRQRESRKAWPRS